MCLRSVDIVQEMQGKAEQEVTGNTTQTDTEKNQGTESRSPGSPAHDPIPNGISAGEGTSTLSCL